MTDRVKFAFWKTVSDCLIEFFGLQEEEASAMVSRLRGKIAEVDRASKSDGDLIYHSEPIHVASDLMGREPARDRVFYDRYRRIQRENLKTHRRKTLLQVSEEILALPSGEEAKRLAAPLSAKKLTRQAKRMQAVRLVNTQ